MTNRNPLSFKGNELAMTGVIMALVIIVQVAIITLCTRLTEGSRVSKLCYEVQRILGDEWRVGEQIAIDAPIATSSAAFALHKDNADETTSNAQEDAVCVAIRVVTLYGPMPCVYVCDTNGARFVGVLGLSGTVAHRIGWEESKKGEQAINYWARIIPSMINIGGGNVQ